MNTKGVLRSSLLEPVLDGVAMNKLHPDTFEIPSNMDKANIRPGDFVKAGFGTGEADAPAERMWVLVSEIKADVIYGLLANVPVLSGAELDDPVKMEFRHVLAINHAEPDLMQQARDWDKRDNEKQAVVRALDEYACDDELIARLYEQRDALLAACEACLLRDDIADGELGDMLREVITKIEGKA